MVGQRFVTLLADHPWFEIVAVAASPRSAGRPYAEAVAGRWAMPTAIPEALSGLPVRPSDDAAALAADVELVFCAVDLPAAETRALEEAYAAHDLAVISANSAHRWTPDVPMLIPEVNPEHLGLIAVQRARRGWRRGLIVTKPNCSLQSYVPAFAALRSFGPNRAFVTTFQAISGAGKRLATCPEIADNVIPLPGEEPKSEREPLRILGRIEGAEVVPDPDLRITAHCQRVAAEDGHLAAVSVGFARRPERDAVLAAWHEWRPRPQRLGLPSAPDPALRYVEGDDRPQTRLDRDAGNGMAVTLGRLRPCALLDYRFLALSHNTLRGAAGGAVLTAELVVAEGYLDARPMAGA